MFHSNSFIETLPHRNVKLQHTHLKTVDLVKMPWNFRHWSVSDIDHRLTGACCACSRCGTFLLPLYWSLFFGRKYREKIVQHNVRAIAVLHFPICAPKSCPAPAALAAGAGHFFSLTPIQPHPLSPLIVVRLKMTSLETF